jgi:hypothetical protein
VPRHPSEHLLLKDAGAAIVSDDAVHANAVVVTDGFER